MDADAIRLEQLNNDIKALSRMITKKFLQAEEMAEPSAKERLREEAMIMRRTMHELLKMKDELLKEMRLKRM